MIEIKNLYKRFGSLEVLTGLDLEIPTAQSIVVIGQSGCGKSVLLKLIVGLLRADEGTIVVDEQDVFGLTRTELMIYRKRLGVLFQSGALFDSMTVAENVGFSLKESLHLKKDRIKEVVDEKLSLVGLADVGDKMPSEMSGGMKKRVALARAIATDPNIILYDEPTTGLDPVTGAMINELIAGVHKKLGVTTIVVTHDMASAYQIADRIVMLYGGKVIWDGTPEEIRKTADEKVQQFIHGSSTGPISINRS